MQPTILAKYPFLPEAFDLVKDESMDEILHSPAFNRARELGVARVQRALKNEDSFLFIDERNCFDVVLSFFISKAIVSQMNDSFLLRRHAIFEAKNAYHYLEEESRETADAVARSLGIKRDRNGVSFVTFLKYSPNAYGQWKLANSRLSGGMVEVDDHTFLRLVQEAVRERVEGIKFSVDGLEKTLDLGPIRAELANRKVTHRADRVELESFPPCMKSIMAQIENSINVPHQGRFSLVAFLNGIGMKEEDIMKIMAPIPDFDDRMTRYQVEHITGKEYSTPSCDTMRTYSLCFEPDGLCARIKHPMQYYEYRLHVSSKKV
jgi:DNA primase large subunit